MLLLAPLPLQLDFALPQLGTRGQSSTANPVKHLLQLSRTALTCQTCTIQRYRKGYCPKDVYWNKFA